jgi:hypothetical protein
VTAQDVRDYLENLIENEYDSMRDFSAKRGVNVSQVSKFLSGAENPDPKVLQALGIEEVPTEKQYRFKKR